MTYAELHCLSNFTFLRGASRPEELAARAAELGYAALAITDECSLAGIVRAHVAAKDAGLKLIVGSEFRLDDGLRLVLLAQNRGGYGRLCALITRSRRAAEKGSYRLKRADLDGGVAGCLALWLPDAEPDADAARWLSLRFPGRLWIAVELLAGAGDRARLERLQALGASLSLPYVAAGDVHMHVRGRRMLQDTLTAIRLGLPVARVGHGLHPSGERHLRSPKALARRYPPALLDETARIAGLCDFDLASLRYEYPGEIVPPNETAASYLRRLVEDGLRWRFASKAQEPAQPAGARPSGHQAPGTGHRFSPESRVPRPEHRFSPESCAESAPRKVRQLVEHELALIAELGYEPYFLTVYDIVKFARDRGILCQGRGSAANSAVCYALGITEVDPSRSEMLFERFISRERNEPPDIDVDFEHQRREEVIQYIYRKYGRDRAALAATVITYRAKSAFRDVGKALGLDLEQVDRISRNFAWWDRKSDRAERLREAGFDPQSPVILRLIALTEELAGFPRHLSQHVGGFVISRGPLCELVPIENAAMPGDPADYDDAPAQRDADAAQPLRTVIQWDKDDLDALGLLKIDVLALGMLSAIRRAIAMVAGWHGKPFTIADVPPEDPAVYEMISRADTIGVFQIESRAQMSMLPRLRPRNFYDLVIEVAIVRPGPIQGGMVHPYLRRRQQLEPVTYPSKEVEQVLSRTLGVPIFQEQVMQLAVVAAGFTPGDADRLRRSMAAWRRKGGLDHFEEKLTRGMRERGYSEAFARQIFQQILGFGEYGFPESHSASFALLVYVSAWLKCHEPAAFTCALLNSQPMGFYAPAQLVQDARRHGVEVRPVDVFGSEWDCTLEGPSGTPGVQDSGRGTRDSGRNRCSVLGAQCSESRSQVGFTRPSALSPRPSSFQPAIRLGLRMVSGLSEAGAQRLVEARAGGGFESVEQLLRAAKLSRRDMECLAAADALVSASGHRRNAAWTVAGIDARPPVLADAPIRETAVDLPPPGEGENIVADYASVGLTLGRHPLALLRARLRGRRIASAEDIRRTPHGKRVRVAGIVTGRQRPGTASGVVFVTLEDETGFVNVVVWGRTADAQRRPLLASRLMAVHGHVEREGDVVHVIAGRILDYSALLGELETRSRDFH
jgi:error-prone DNA polymerase